MDAWILLWKALFFVSIAIFAGMAVWVTIGGAADIKRLFARLSEAAHTMGLELSCPHCQATFRLTMAEAGKYGRCQSCSAIVRLEPSPLDESLAILIEEPEEDA
jgi:hypothetical protein